MKLRPLGERILIQPQEAESKTPGGLFVPDQAKEKPARGTVVALGAGRIKDDGTREPIDVAVGDVVIYGKYSGSEIELHGEKFVIALASEIYGVVES